MDVSRWVQARIAELAEAQALSHEHKGACLDSLARALALAHDAPLARRHAGQAAFTTISAKD